MTANARRPHDDPAPPAEGDARPRGVVRKAPVIRRLSLAASLPAALTVLLFCYQTGKNIVHERRALASGALGFLASLVVARFIERRGT